MIFRGFSIHHRLLRYEGVGRAEIRWAVAGLGLIVFAYVTIRAAPPKDVAGSIVNWGSRFIQDGESAAEDLPSGHDLNSTGPSSLGTS